jgi:integrase
VYGLRRGEVLGLRWSDIDLKQGRQALVKIHHIV